MSFLENHRGRSKGAAANHHAVPGSNGRVEAWRWQSQGVAEPGGGRAWGWQSQEVAEPGDGRAWL